MALTANQVLMRMRAAGILRDSASDSDASKVIGIFPKMKYDGALIKVGTRINFGGKLYRARVDLWDKEEYTPDSVPSLWEAVEYRDGYRVITAAITAEHPFGIGERAWFDGDLYESKIANNVWRPNEYPAGWNIIEGGNE